ncbi:MAG: hypothetical protein IJH96_00205 [Ruminococcus sp.]|nr:hypothetical protein [Ruminococcus sp.]
MSISDKTQTASVADHSDTEREHQVYLNVQCTYEEAKIRRGNYRRYGTLFVILSGIVFLTLMFSLNYKIEFLILWVVTDFICAALMIRSEYKVYQIETILGISEENADEYTAENAEENAGEDTETAAKKATEEHDS